VTFPLETQPSNPFDPAALRLDQSYADSVGVKKLLTTVPVRKPNRQDFVRVHPDPTYRLTPAAIIEVKEDREIYLVKPNMAQELPGEFTVATLHTAINRQGVPFLWPVKLPGPDGKHNEWHRKSVILEGIRSLVIDCTKNVSDRVLYVERRIGEDVVGLQGLLRHPDTTTPCPHKTHESSYRDSGGSPGLMVT
jgi:hypothetical protein